MADAHTRLRMTDISAWPEEVRALAWCRPWVSLPLEVDAAGIALAEDCAEVAPKDLFPKLAIKSWQESGRLRLIPGELPLRPALEARLASPTRQQMTVLRAWADAEAPPFLHLFPWHDMSKVSEVRYAWTNGQIRVLSACRRGGVSLDGGDFSRVTQRIAEQMPGLGNFIAQFAIELSGRAGIVDINPILDQETLLSLTA